MIKRGLPAIHPGEFLAETLDEPHAAGAAWVDAGMIFHEAAEDQAEGEAQSSARERELRREAF